MHKRKLWFWLMTVSSVIYIGWRLFFTIPTESGLVSLIAGIALFTAEAVSMTEAVLHFICMDQNREPELPDIALADYPDVDILIATHSEDTDLLFKTVNGCIHMEYPDLSKVHIYLCDDGNRPEVAKLAQDMGIGCFQLEENKLAKAGNLNNALSQTHSPLIVTMDADMIPRSNFLMMTVPYFFLPKMIQEDGVWRKRTEDEIDPNFKIGFIQTPQSFYNPDLFQFNFFAERNIPNEQDYFFREVNVGRNGSNSAIYAGSNTVLSREALEEVGGIRTGTITEDFATGIDIQAKGYTCYAIKTVLASGLAPTDFPNLLKQRQRWGRGCVQTIRSLKFWFTKLSLRSKLSYFSCLLYWWTFLRRIIYILSPILYTVFGVLVVKADIFGLACIWLPSYLIYNHALRIISGKVRDQKWSNIVDTILSPYMVVPIMAETLGIRMRKFSVTSKERETTKSAKMIYAVPHTILLLATAVGICMGTYRVILQGSFGNLVVIFWLLMNGYFLVMSILFMTGRVNYRSSERYYSEMPVKFVTCGKEIEAATRDISEGGFSFVTDFPEFLDAIHEFTLHDAKWTAQVTGTVVHVTKLGDKWKYSVKLEQLSQKAKGDYYQLVYDRVPTLASKIKSTALKDLHVFMQRKAATTVQSQRELPRIDLNRSFKTLEGETVTVLDYNYHYITLTAPSLRKELDLVFGTQVLHLIKAENMPKENLYEIQNWKTISNSYESRANICDILTQSAQEENLLTV